MTLHSRLTTSPDHRQITFCLGTLDRDTGLCYAVHMYKHRFNLLLPGELWRRIHGLALHNRRPVTQEILIAIEKHVESAPARQEDEPAP